MKRTIVLPVALALSLSVAGCGDRPPIKRSWGRMKGLKTIVGNMNDTSYSSGRTQEPRTNALDKPVSMPAFEGSFVWVEYAAPWCKVCSWQAPQAKQVEKELGDDLIFLTIMTSNSEAYNDHATVDTAKGWAGRFGLNPERVLAAELWFKTIPEHRLYSPQGHTLFVHVGGLSSTQIKDVIAYYRPGWENWAKTGTKSRWMTFQ